MPYVSCFCFAGMNCLIWAEVWRSFPKFLSEIMSVFYSSSLLFDIATDLRKQCFVVFWHLLSQVKCVQFSVFISLGFFLPQEQPHSSKGFFLHAFWNKRTLAVCVHCHCSHRCRWNDVLFFASVISCLIWWSWSRVVRAYFHWGTLSFNNNLISEHLKYLTSDRTVDNLLCFCGEWRKSECRVLLCWVRFEFCASIP